MQTINKDYRGYSFAINSEYKTEALNTFNKCIQKN